MRGIELKTRRLLLRTVRPGDAEAIYGYRSRPEISRYQGEPKSAASVRARIELIAAAKPAAPRTWHQLAIVEKESGALIGDVSIHFKDEKQAELGYTLSPGSQGRGFATEAVAAVVDWLFGKLKKHRLTATADARNKNSLKLMKRLGMRKEAHFKKSFWNGREWADDLAYAILREEWGGRKK